MPARGSKSEVSFPLSLLFMKGRKFNRKESELSIWREMARERKKQLTSFIALQTPMTNSRESHQRERMPFCLPQRPHMIPAQADAAQADSPHSAPVPSQSEPPQKKRRASHLIPKLTVEDFSEASFRDVIKIGRRAKARGKPVEGREAKALGPLLRDISAWSKEVAPHYSFSQFIFASQALGTNRSLRPMLANLRLAEFREVNVDFQSTPAVDRSAKTSEGGGHVAAEAPPDELEALEGCESYGEYWADEDVMLDRMELEISAS